MTPLRFIWRRTWSDRPHDYTAINDAGHTIRVYLDKVSPAFAGQYYWVASRNVFLGSGYAKTAREAAVAAEACYFRGEESG